MASFNTVQEVREFFAAHGVEALEVVIEGDCIAVSVATFADIATMRVAGLQVVSTTRHSGELAVVFYPTRPE